MARTIVSRRPCTFKQQDVTRALKGSIKAGIEVVRIEIGKDGNIVLVTAAEQKPQIQDPYEKWKAANG